MINVQCHHLTNRKVHHLYPCHWLPQQTHAYCCICKKPGPKLVIIPTESRTAVFVERNFLIPHENSCCPVHFDNGAISSDAFSSSELKKNRRTKIPSNLNLNLHRAEPPVLKSRTK